MKRWSVLQRTAFVAVALAATSWTTSACDFCAKYGRSLADSAADVKIVVVGKLRGADQNAQTTQLEITTALKVPDEVKGKRTLVVARFLPFAREEESQRLVFGDLIKGEVDPSLLQTIDSADMVGYLRESMRLQHAPPLERFSYFFTQLQNADPVVSEDAYKEFGKANYPEVAAARAGYKADELLSWIADGKTAAHRIGLYGLLVGLCGRAQDAAVLSKLSETDDSRLLVGLDGILGGYCLLDPTRGVERTLAIMTNPKLGFAHHFAALRTVRFILTRMPSVDRGLVLRRLAEAVALPDVADLAIDELRKQRYWDPLEKILAIKGEDDVKVPAAVIRYALACPKPQAVAYIADLERRDKEAAAKAKREIEFEEDLQRQADETDDARLRGTKKEKTR